MKVKDIKISIRLIVALTCAAFLVGCATAPQIALVRSIVLAPAISVEIAGAIFLGIDRFCGWKTGSHFS